VHTFVDRDLSNCINLNTRQELAKKRSMNQKRSNSTDDCLIEHRTISYSPRVDPQEVRNLLPMIDNHIKRKSLSHFGREYSAKL